MAEVVTGEAVVLEVPCARFPSRLLALAMDLTIQVVLLFILFVIVGLAITGDHVNGAAGGAITLTVSILIVVGYPVLWETLTRGGTPGKFALGLRVVSDDGGPERFRQALVRGLAAVVEIWLLLGFPALISSLLSARGKRLGDIFAGTFVIQQRLPAGRGGAALPVVSPELTAWAAQLEMSGLTDQTAETARRYLARLPELTPAAQAELGDRIAGAVRAQVSPLPPPGTPAVAYLSAVLAERRNREHARLAVSAARGSPERGAPGRGLPGPGSPGPGWVRPAGPRPAGESYPRAGPPGPAVAWEEPIRAAREGEPEQIPPANGAGGFVPPA